MWFFFLMLNDIALFYIYFLAICIFSLDKVLFSVLPNFFVLFVFVVELL